MLTYGNVYMTFEVSADYLQNSGLSECLDALQLLHVLAFMHNSQILETLFRKASNYANKLREIGPAFDDDSLRVSVSNISRLPGNLQRGWDSNLQDRLRWREACTVLESLSLIAVHEVNSSIEISTHSLIHAWAKERQDFESQCVAWQSAATILALSCEGWYAFCTFFTYLQLHVRACVSHQFENYAEDMSDVEAAQILFQLAYVLYRTSDNTSLSYLVQKIRSKLQDIDELDPEIREAVEFFTGRVEAEKGNYREAVYNYRKVLESRALRLTKDHPDQLSAQSALAQAYERNGQTKEAIILLEQVVKVEENLSEDHPSRLASQHELASAYQANGQINKAVDLLEKVVQIQEKLAEDHPSRLASQHQLAGVYEANGQINKAVDLLEKVVQIKEKLAEDHPSRLASQHELAGVYEANGQIDEAIKLLEHVVKIQKEVLAEDHPDRLVSQHELARVYLANGQIDKAIKLLKHVIKIQKEVLAEDHPDRLISQHKLARVYLANG